MEAHIVGDPMYSNEISWQKNIYIYMAIYGLVRVTLG